MLRLLSVVHSLSRLPQRPAAQAKELISKLLVVDPAKRLTMDETLAHPWLAEAVAKTREVRPAAPPP